MFISQDINGNLHETVDSLNRRGLSEHVHSLHGISGGTTIVVFTVATYSEYMWMCEKLSKEPKTLDEFSRGIV